MNQPEGDEYSKIAPDQKSMTLHAYIPQDRLRTLARGESLPDRTEGSALFADISGFTPLTEKLTHEFGTRRGIEELSHRINSVYDAMIDEIDRFGGSVVNFAGDAVTCWFDRGIEHPSLRAAICAQALQNVLKQFPDLSIKIAICTGPVRRFAVGDPAIQMVDTLAGATIARLAAAEHQAKPGDTILDQNTTNELGIPNLTRCTSEAGEEFFILDPSKVGTAQIPSASGSPSEDKGFEMDPKLLRPWILPLVFDRETAGHAILLTELRPTTALFIRFTGIDYDDDPTARDKLDAFIQGTQQVIYRHEGALLELTIGDKGSYIYASFGATHIHENDSLRAIRSAMEIKKKFAASDTVESIQIGVSSGTMRVGGIGGRSRKSFGALGNEVNLAARLMTSAAPDEILVSRRVQKGGEAEFAFEARPPILLKGKSEPIPVFAVLGTLQHRAIRLKEPSYTLPMIGRENELNVIAKNIELVSGGMGQIIGITGEAGMGKSRLVAEGIRLARRNNMLGYGGTCQSDGTNTPYLVWHSIWNAYFNLDPAVPLRKQIRSIEGELEDCAPEHLDALPLLGAVLGLPLPENDFTRSLQPSDRKNQLETMLAKCLRFTANEYAEENSGLLLVLEDLHWIDPVSLDLLAHIAKEIVNLPVLILLTYRPPESDSDRNLLAPFHEMDQFLQLTLTELNTEESGQAIRAKLAHLFPEHRGGVPPILIQRVTERAQGNPFYVEELLNYMRDRGINPHNPESLKMLDLPVSLHSLILSRINQLTASQQLILKVASIIGRRFEFDHLYNYYPALGTLEQVKSDLHVLERLDITPLESPEPDLTYLFKHLVTHEVGYESIAFSQRAQLHGQYADFLEKTYPDRLDAFTPQLAHHYDRAGNKEKGRHYLNKAGEQAAANFANEEALAYFNRTLILSDETILRLQFDTLLRRERVYDLIGRRTEQRHDLDQLDRLANEFEDANYLRSQIALRRARLEMDEGDYQAALSYAQMAIRELNEITTPAKEKADLNVDALWLEGRAMFYAGKAAESKPLLEKALEMARSEGYARGEYNALAQLGLWYWYNGDNATARKLLEESLDLIRQAGDIRREVDILINLGIVTKDMYRFTESLAYYAQAQSIARKIGDRSGEAHMLNNMGRASLVSGDFVKAIEYCYQSARLAGEVNESALQGIALYNQGDAYRNLWQYHSARDTVEESLRLLRSAGYRLGEADALEVLAVIVFAIGEQQHALTLAEDALAIGREIASRRVEVSVLIRIGLMQLEMGQIEKAEEVFRQANGMEDAFTDRLLQFELQAGSARAALARSDPDSVAKAVALIKDLVSEILREPHTDQSRILPLRLYLDCIQVMEAVRDPEVGRLIARAGTELHARSENISDDSLRADFLAIPEHRMISQIANRTSSLT